MNAPWLHQAIDWFTTLFPQDSFFSWSFNVRAMLALILVSLCCGGVGSVVVGSRMAFFSDALAHCAFAGVSIGFIIFDNFLAGVRPAEEFWQWVTPIMVIFGILVGLGIALVRQQTELASDTVIGVFFASAIGLTALLRKLITNRSFFSLEEFLFGDPLYATAGDLVMLFFLVVLTFGLLGRISNSLILARFNTSLALSRRINVNVQNILFVVLLAIIVNMCLRSVGVLLINALLVVPAATAANVSSNMRQMFRRTVGLCLFACLLGQWLSWEMGIRYDLDFGVSGVIVLMAVVLFITSMIVGPFLRSWPRSTPVAAPATE